jgi:hypothetical protein
LALLVLGTPLAAAEPAAAQTKKPTAPSWLGSTAGVSNRVLAPFTPVEIAGNRVSVWGRTYTFAGLPFPATITAREKELLAAPVTLSGVAGGKPIVWSEALCHAIVHRPDLVQLATRADSAALRCEGQVSIEYDGMVRCDFTLTPLSTSAAIDRLALEIPLHPETAKYLHFWPGRWNSVFNSAALPANGYRGPFRPFVWLGDEWRGLGWFCESDRDFTPANKDQAIAIERQADRVVLRVNLIARPRTLDGPLSYTFGFQATPIKPARPDAWDYRICHLGGYGIDDRPFAAPDQHDPKSTLLDYLARSGVRTICFHEHWTDIQAYPATTHGAALHKLVRACHDHHIQLLLYHGYEMSNVAPEWADYHDECLVQPRAGGYKRKPEQTAYIVCYRSHWQDFIAQGIDRLMDQYGIDGVYLDGTSEPWACSNPRHGCGYRRADGSIGPTYSIFATRAMMKRIYTIVKSHNPAGQVNVHQSSCMTTPTLAFATSYWDGEQFQGLKRRAAAGEVLPLDAFRCEFMGHNWGLPAELLWYGTGPLRRTEAMAMGLLHDVPVRPAGAADVAEMARIWRARDELGAAQAAWLPYWENERYVQTGSIAVKASLHNRPGRGLIVVVCNMGSAPCTAPVQLNLEELKQPANLAAVDVLTGRKIPVVAGKFEIALPALDYAMVRLEPDMRD